MNNIRPSSDLRNKYPEISRICKETKKPMYITVNGRGDTVVMDYEVFQQMELELSALKSLARAEEDVKQGRVSELGSVFDDLREKL